MNGAYVCTVNTGHYNYNSVEEPDRKKTTTRQLSVSLNDNFLSLQIDTSGEKVIVFLSFLESLPIY